MEKQLIGVALIALCAAGAGYVFVYPYLSGERQAQKRQAALISAGPGRQASKSVDQAKRRKALADSLNEVGNKKKTVDLGQRIEQAGLDWSKASFLLASAVIGLALGGIGFVLTLKPLVAGGGLLVGAFGLPNWILAYLRNRRTKKFIEEFPGAIDIIVRGVRAGLPLGDCFRVVANETQDPVRQEFKKIVDAQAVGMTMAEAVERFAASVPVAEVAFFAIVISLQQKAGGNLSETLSNLSAVLRDRKKMKEKVKAISSEAKASASIIGSLPFLVGGVVYLTSPDYIMVLFSTSTGNMILAGCLFWMGIGIFIMRQMINFEV
ncbi:MAG: type II secretion system F family protein [Methylocystis sp.]|uniref:type II secretion system F family protein n=1 Tax=Methylocystis sp. TaxID=1911079 RepID=UPI003DA467F1